MPGRDGIGDALPGGAVGAGQSFPAGTEVLTPEGKVAIEELREGDLVIARHEDAGEIGEYPVSALMSRQAPGLVWLEISDRTGVSMRLGVTREHPVFTKGTGWQTAGELAPGDRIRDANLQELTVLSISVSNVSTYRTDLGV